LGQIGEPGYDFRQEDTRFQLHEVCKRTWPGNEHPLGDAVQVVLEASGEAGVWVDNQGAISGPADSLDRIAQRAGYELKTNPPAYIDRTGYAHHPFDVGVELAKAFAGAKPQTVLLTIETEEEQYSRESREIGNSYLVPLVQRWRAGWALCRQWAGFDQAIARREAEIERLRRIISDLQYDLRRAGHDELATKIERKLNR